MPKPLKPGPRLRNGTPSLLPRFTTLDGAIMSLRLAIAAFIGLLFMAAGLAVGQTPAPAPERAVGDPVAGKDTAPRQRERSGAADADMATGTFGGTGRGAAAGAADSKPAEGRRSPGGDETMSEPTGPGSAERRPGTAVPQ
jgi:hypothetical protein